MVNKYHRDQKEDKPQEISESVSVKQTMITNMTAAEQDFAKGEVDGK